MTGSKRKNKNTTLSEQF